MDWPLRHEAPGSTLIVPEVIDIANQEAAVACVRRAVAACPTRVLRVVLLEPVVTATAIAVLLRARRDAVDRGVTLRVSASGLLARKVFRLTGTDRALDVVYDEGGFGVSVEVDVDVDADAVADGAIVSGGPVSGGPVTGRR